MEITVGMDNRNKIPQIHVKILFIVDFEIIK